MADQVSLPPVTIRPDTRPAAVAAKADQAKPAEAKPADSSFWPSFHEVLSALNPLQYIPVVGTIYRSATGDTIPENTRFAGSLVFSGLTSGPVGIATTVATNFLERVTGFDPEKIGHNVLASLGLGSKTPDAAKPATETAAAAPANPAAAGRALTAKELAAYGVTQTKEGDLRRGDLQGADVLNAIELSQLRGATVASLASAAYKDSSKLPAHS